MVRSLHTAATGMNSMQFHIDTISHNIANVNTYGYKKMRAEFEDLIYQTHKIAGTPATEETVIPTGIQVGLGSKTAATQRILDTGSLQETGNKLDMALEGQGYFKVQLPDGTMAYTRDGTWKIDKNRQVVNSNGLRMQPEIIFPENTINDSISISKEGLVTVKVANSDERIDVGQIQTYRFVNPAGLSNYGENLLKVTEASGAPIEGTPGLDGFPKVHQGFLEMSNVKVVDEMVNMITAQRAYEFNSKAIQTSDSMLQTAVALKR
ncbi:MAG TPA: flagellar basal-body rod protein FlgG [Spirochaetota bacterium]|nr:flagellar basal-body rod protein FlgG [Spirochaetota bacterium]